MFNLFELGGNIVIKGLETVSSQLGVLQQKLQLNNNAINGIQNATLNAGAKLESFNNVVQEHSRSIQTVGVAITAVGAGILAFGTNAVKMAGDFDLAMRNVAAVQNITDLTSESFKRLTAEAQRLGAETVFTAQDAAEGMQILSQAGLDVEETLSAIGPALELAAAGGVSIADAADIITSAVTTFGLTTQEALSGVADTLTETSIRTKADLTELGEGLKFVAPLSAALGISFEQTSAALGLLGDAGIKAEMAGTGLRGAMVRVLAPTKEATQVMERMGVNVINANGTFKDLVGILKEFEGAQKRAGSEVEFTADLMTIFAQRAGPAMLNLIKAGSDNLQELEEQVSQTGAAARVAEAKMSGLGGSFFRLESAYEGFKLALINSGIGDMVEVVIRGLADVFEWLSKLDPAILKWGGIFVAAVGGISAVLGPLLLVLPAIANLLATGIAPGALSAAAGLGTAGTAANLLGMAFTGIGTIATGPVGLVIAAIVALTAALVIFQDDIKLAAEGLAGFADESIKTTSDADAAWKGFWEFFSSLPAAFIAPFKRDWADLMTFISELMRKSGLDAYAWGKYLTNLSDVVVDGLTKALTTLLLGGLAPLVDVWGALVGKGRELEMAQTALTKAQKTASKTASDLALKEKERQDSASEVAKLLEDYRKEQEELDKKLREGAKTTADAAKVDKELADQKRVLAKEAKELQAVLDRNAKAADKNKVAFEQLLADLKYVTTAYAEGRLTVHAYNEAIENQLIVAVKLAQERFNAFVETLDESVKPALDGFISQIDSVARVIDENFAAAMDRLRGTLENFDVQGERTKQILKDLGVLTDEERAARIAEYQKKVDDLSESFRRTEISATVYKEGLEALDKEYGYADESTEKLDRTSRGFGDTLSRQVSTIVSDFGKKVADVVIEGGKMKDVFDQVKKSLLRLVTERLMTQFIGFLDKILARIPGLERLSGIFSGVPGGTGGGGGGGAAGAGGAAAGLGGSAASTGFGLATAILSLPSQGKLAEAVKGGVGGGVIGGTLLSMFPALLAVPVIGPFLPFLAAGVGALTGWLFGGRKKVKDTELADKTFPFMREAVRAYERGDITAEQAAAIIDGGWQTMVEGFTRPQSVQDQEQYYLAIVEWFKEVQDEKAEAKEEAAEAAEEAKNAIKVPRATTDEESRLLQQTSESAVGAVDKFNALATLVNQYTPTGDIVTSFNGISEKFKSILQRAKSGEGLTSLFPELQALLGDTERTSSSLATAIESAPEEIQESLKLALASIQDQLDFTDEAIRTIIASLQDGAEIPDILTFILSDMFRAEKIAAENIGRAGLPGAEDVSPISSQQTTTAASKFGEYLKRGVAGLRDVVGKVANDVYVGDVQVQLDNITSGLIDIFNKISAGTFVDSDFETLRDLFTSAQEAAGDLADALGSSTVEGADALQDFVDALGDGFSSLEDSADTAFGELDDLGKIKTALEILFGPVIREFSNAGTILDDFIESIGDDVEERTAAFTEFTTIIDTASDLLLAGFHGTATEQQLTDLKAIFNDAKSSIKDVFDILEDMGFEHADSISEGFQKTFGDFDTRVTQIVGDLGKANTTRAGIQKKLQDKKEDRADLLADLATASIEDQAKIRTKIADVDDEITGLENDLKTNQALIDGLEIEFNTVLADLQSVSTDIQGMMSQFTSTNDAVSGAVQTFFQHLLDIVNGATDAAIDLAGDAEDSFGNPASPDMPTLDSPLRSRSGQSDSGTGRGERRTPTSSVADSDYFGIPAFMEQYQRILSLVSSNPLAFTGLDNPFAQQALGGGIPINISGNTFNIRSQEDIIAVAEQLYRLMLEDVGTSAMV